MSDTKNPDLNILYAILKGIEQRIDWLEDRLPVQHVDSLQEVFKETAARREDGPPLATFNGHTAREWAQRHDVVVKAHMDAQHELAVCYDGIREDEKRTEALRAEVEALEAMVESLRRELKTCREDLWEVLGARDLLVEKVKRYEAEDAKKEAELRAFKIKSDLGL